MNNSFHGLSLRIPARTQFEKRAALGQIIARRLQPESQRDNANKQI